MEALTELEIRDIQDLVGRLLNSQTNDAAKEKITLEITKKDFQEIILTLGGAIADKRELSEKSELLDGAKKTLTEAYSAFKDADTEARGLQEVKKIFGWKHKEPVNRERLFWEYMDLIHGGIDFETFTLKEDAVSKKEAINILRERYQFASYDAAFKQIQRAIQTRKNFCKDKYDMNGNFKGLLPGNWPEV